MIDRVLYLKECFEHKAYAEKAFLISLISIQFEDEDSSGKFKKIPFAAFVEQNKYYYINSEGKQVQIEGNVNDPLFRMDHVLSIDKDYHPMITESMLTTFGIFLTNIICFWEVFGKIVPYHNGEFSNGLVRGILSRIMVDDPKEGEDVPEGKAPVSLCMRFSEHTNFLEGIAPYVVVTASVDALTIDKSILKRKEELLKEYAGKLNDPVVYQNIVDELVQMDYDLQMKGKSKTFYIEKKFIDNARKRMFIMFGLEHNEQTGEFIPLTNSLDQGWEMEHVTEYVNTAVVASYARGIATGQGGAEVKTVLRLIGRSSVEGEDCGTSVGEPIDVTKSNSSLWVGAYYIKNNKPELITKENVESLIGKEIMVRVPQYCVTKDGNYCRTCLGTGLGALKNRISSTVVSIPNAFMINSLKLMHVSGGGTVKLNLDTSIS